MDIACKMRMIRRWIYGVRSYIPGLQHQHRIESLVGPLGYWNQLQRYQLSAVTKLGLLTQHHLLDIGCGPLQGGIAFIRFLEPNRYFGVDNKAVAISAACEEISRQQLWKKRPRLILSTSFGDDQLGDMQFDFIWLSQVLYYFDESTLHSLFAMACRRLSPGGVLAGDILGPGSDSSFLRVRNPRPPAHTHHSIDRLARAHGFRASLLGRLNEFGYPKRLNLSHNLLLKITRQPA